MYASSDPHERQHLPCTNVFGTLTEGCSDVRLQEQELFRMVYPRQQVVFYPPRFNYCLTWTISTHRKSYQPVHWKLETKTSSTNILDIEPLVRSWKNRYNILQHNTTYTTKPPDFWNTLEAKRSLKGNKLNFSNQSAPWVLQARLRSAIHSSRVWSSGMTSSHVKIDINKY